MNYFYTSRKFQIFSLIAIVSVSLGVVQRTDAACFTTAIGNTTASTCSIAADTTECDDGAQNNEASTTNNAVLSIPTGVTVTIANGSAGTTNLYVGSIALSGTGTLATPLVASAKVAVNIGSPCWVADADADGFITNTTLSTATAAGKRRLGLMRHPSTADCNDASYNTTNVCWSYSYGQAWYYGYGQGGYWGYGYGQGGYWGYGYGESMYCSWSMPSCGPE